MIQPLNELELRRERIKKVLEEGQRGLQALNAAIQTTVRSDNLKKTAEKFNHKKKIEKIEIKRKRIKDKNKLAYLVQQLEEELRKLDASAPEKQESVKKLEKPREPIKIGPVKLVELKEEGQESALEKEIREFVGAVTETLEERIQKVSMDKEKGRANGDALSEDNLENNSEGYFPSESLREKKSKEEHRPEEERKKPPRPT